MNPRFAALLCAALLLRVIVSIFPGYPDDRAYFQAWSQTLAAHGPLAIYGNDVTPRVDYAPGYLYVLWAIGLVHAAIGGGPATWRALLTVVPIASDLALIALMYRYACKRTTPSRALALAGILAFAPPLWIDSSLFGQADAFPIALAFIAITRATEGRFGAAWPALCSSILVKPLSIALVPILSVLQTRARPIWKGLALSMVVSLGLAYLISLPFTSDRGPADVFGFLFERYANGASKVPFVTWGAFTIYPLVTGFKTPDATHFGPLSFRLWGIIAVVVAIGAIAGTLARSLVPVCDDPARSLRILGAASLSLLVLFFLATRMHERYLLPGLAFGAPLALEDRPSALALASLALTFTINCAFTMLGFSGDGHHPQTLTIARLCSAANLLAIATLCQRQYARLNNDTRSDAAHGEGS